MVNVAPLSGMPNGVGGNPATRDSSLGTKFEFRVLPPDCNMIELQVVIF